MTHATWRYSASGLLAYVSSGFTFAWLTHDARFVFMPMAIFASGFALLSPERLRPQPWPKVWIIAWLTGAAFGAGAMVLHRFQH